MVIALSFSKLPELKKFSKAHRQLIYADCIEPMLAQYALRRIRNFIAVIVFIVTMVFVRKCMAWEGLPHFIVEPLISLVVGTLAALGFSHVWDVTMISRHRKELHRRIGALVWEKMTAPDIFGTPAREAVRPTQSNSHT